MNSSNKFTKDIGWKLLSLAIAIGLWFTVINTENPLETRSYSATIQIQNQESLFERGYVVVNDDEISSTRITVRLRGQRLALDTLSQSSTKVQAIVDLDNVIYSYNGEPVSVPVNIVPAFTATGGMDHQCKIHSIKAASFQHNSLSGTAFFCRSSNDPNFSCNSHFHKYFR